MARKDPALEFTETHLQGNVPQASDLERLTSAMVREGQHIEYKSGQEIALHGKSHKLGSKATHTLRQYVSAFANADGGTLVIGVREITPGGETTNRATDIDGITNYSNPQQLQDDVVRALSDLAGFLTPPPRVSVVSHPKGLVLVVSVARSFSLVPCTVRGKMIHYFRLGDQTLEAPTYLMQDLVLGRRRHPKLKLEFSTKPMTVQLSPRRHAGEHYSPELTLPLGPQLFNDGLLWVKNAAVGLVGYSRQQNRITSPDLLNAVEIIPLANSAGSTRRDSNLMEVNWLSTRSIVRDPVGPYEQITLAGTIEVPIRIDSFFLFEYKAAAYVVAEHSPPQWYQVVVQSELAMDACRLHISCDSVGQSRPTVSFEEQVPR